MEGRRGRKEGRKEGERERARERYFAGIKSKSKY
jgi:hypothetical protein